jgi:hypothetical protein
VHGLKTCVNARTKARVARQSVRQASNLTVCTLTRLHRSRIPNAEVTETGAGRSRAHNRVTVSTTRAVRSCGLPSLFGSPPARCPSHEQGFNSAVSIVAAPCQYAVLSLFEEHPEETDNTCRGETRHFSHTTCSPTHITNLVKRRILRFYYSLLARFVVLTPTRLNLALGHRGLSVAQTTSTLR